MFFDLKSRLTRRGLLLAAACGAILVPALASQQTPDEPAHTNFSGRWRMVKSQSDFAGFDMPDIIVQVIDQHDPTLNVHTIQTTRDKTTTADVSYFTDGTPSNNVISGRNAESKAFWDGADLVVRTKMKTSKGEDQVIEDRWQLSENKQTLTRTSHIETGHGQVDMKLVCERDNVGG